ncbi:phosphatidylinositol diacylglycerol-lyase [Actibacterium atlanticum]|uniref:Phosphatidylinositol diacylglycerol-lyase n=1 Tax=Actibacterium atlanticum TaxID=1461693 RepID=A0A058ZK52_9RHOB|nr:hypothetical protein [Actibacterium atlanticum]KCV81943.1 phosphatidylinositol diacylglycerol-lyase [Actibacterium atlanticum]
MSSGYSVSGTVESGEYQLEYLGCWGSDWTTPPQSIPPKSSTAFRMDTSGRGGFWFRVIDTSGDEAGFAAMSFNTPVIGKSSAEGSNSDYPHMVDAGLQTYKSDDHCTLTYKVGTPNKASWSSRDSCDTKDVTCDETKLDDVRAFVTLQNSLISDLSLISYWNDNSDGAENWLRAPCQADMPPPGKSRTLLLLDNDRAGVWVKTNDFQFNLTFSNRIHSPNAAEGSAFSGLRYYERSGVPVSYEYCLGTANWACWDSGKSDDGEIEDDHTKIKTPLSANWMGRMKSQYPNFGKLPLHKAAIPGSHDTACWDMMKVIELWAETQALDFKSQLELGIRYMDLRLKFMGRYLPAIVGHRFHHGSFEASVTMLDLQNQVEEFYESDWDNRKNEILILDFTHFENYEDSDDLGYEDLAAAVGNCDLTKYLIRNRASGSGDLGRWPPLMSDLWSAPGRRRVILSVPFDPPTHIASPQDSQYFWNGKKLFAKGWNGTKFWPNTNDVDDLVTALKKRLQFAPYVNANPKAKNTTALWVLQDILTSISPLPGMQANAELAKMIFNPASLPELEDKVNIAIQDYVDPRLVDRMIDINTKRLKA